MPGVVLTGIWPAQCNGFGRVDIARQVARALPTAVAQNPVGRGARALNLKKAVVLLSGGLDSATVLASARSEGYECHCLSVDYHQRHVAELHAADRVAHTLGAVEHRVFQLDLSVFGGSALTDTAIAVPEAPTEGMPVTYVPARNTIMLSLALAWAEVL